MTKVKLTGKQEAYCIYRTTMQEDGSYPSQADAYRHSYNAKGMTDNTLYHTASMLEKKPKVAQRLKELRDVVREKAETELGINAEYVLRKLKEMQELDVLDIVTDDLTAFKPLNLWPKTWRTSISGLDLAQIIQGEDMTTVIKKIKWPDKVKNLELIGKHVDVNAFQEQVNHTASEDLVNLIRGARGRANKKS